MWIDVPDDEYEGFWKLYECLNEKDLGKLCLALSEVKLNEIKL